MYAVIRTGGKQYKVAKDDVIKVERLEAEAGASVELDDVLLLADGDSVTTGTPTVEGARVAAEVLEQGRGPKLIIFKKKRRKNYRRKNGHRQDLTVLRITDIMASGDGKRAKTAAKSKTATPDAEEQAPADAESSKE